MKLSRILIIHPSRGRPDMAAANAGLLMKNRTSSVGFRYIFSLDVDDPSVPQYNEKFRYLSFEHSVIVHPNRTVIEAINRAAATLENEDLIINMNDDFSSSSGWDDRLKEFVDGIGSPEYLVQPIDMDNGENIPVVQIISAALYRRLGYLLPPMYESMYADNDLLESCQKIGVVHPCRGLGFEHLHPNYGKGKWDETYARENRPGAYVEGRATLEDRRCNNFGLTL